MSADGRSLTRFIHVRGSFVRSGVALLFKRPRRQDLSAGLKVRHVDLAEPGKVERGRPLTYRWLREGARRSSATRETKQKRQLNAVCSPELCCFNGVFMLRSDSCWLTAIFEPLPFSAQWAGASITVTTTTSVINFPLYAGFLCEIVIAFNQGPICSKPNGADHNIRFEKALLRSQRSQNTLWWNCSPFFCSVVCLNSLVQFSAREQPALMTLPTGSSKQPRKARSPARFSVQPGRQSAFTNSGSRWNRVFTWLDWKQPRTRLSVSGHIPTTGQASGLRFGINSGQIPRGQEALNRYPVTLHIKSKHTSSSSFSCFLPFFCSLSRIINWVLGLWDLELPAEVIWGGKTSKLGDQKRGCFQKCVATNRVITSRVSPAGNINFQKSFKCQDVKFISPA